jgi:hypothetical protein
MNVAAPELRKIPFVGGDHVARVINPLTRSTEVPNMGAPRKNALSKKFSPTPCTVSAVEGSSCSTASDEIMPVTMGAPTSE